MTVTAALAGRASDRPWLRQYRRRPAATLTTRRQGPTRPLVVSGDMQGDRQSDLLTVADVMARYRLRDRRAARRVMDAAGGFKIGAGLFVRLSDLFELEERQRAARQSASSVSPTPAMNRSRRPLEPGWWRDDSSEAA
jgi:hypothetical protein